MVRSLQGLHPPAADERLTWGRGQTAAVTAAASAGDGEEAQRLRAGG